MDTMKIPRNATTGTPEVTTTMKVECMGEFTIERGQVCPSCYEMEGPEADSDCTICHGEYTYMEKIDIPWDIVKAIYKRMAAAAAREVRQ